MRSDSGKASYSVPPMNAEQFTESLKRRREAADKLENDLLNDVPMLYGAPGSIGDVGLANIRRDEMRRRSDGGLLTDRSPTERLPFERAMIALGVLIFVVILLLKIS